MNKQVDLESLANRVTLLEREKEHLLGKVLGLHGVVVALLLEREGPTEDLISHLAYANEANQATSLPTGLSDAAIAELTGVVAQAQKLAQSIVATRGHRRWRNGRPVP